MFFIVGLNLLTAQAQKERAEHKQVEILLEKSKKLAQTALDSSFFYAEKAIQTSKLINNDTLLAKANIQKSSLHIFKKEFDKSDALLQENLEKELPRHLKGLTLHNLGTIQYYKQDFKKR
ncbi:hypothetical protein M601_010350 [Cellulophaga baltica 4]|nr:hypothetical protein M601_010350 [Cellulophaga baltica 4]